MRTFSFIDRVIQSIDVVLPRSQAHRAGDSHYERAYPAAQCPEDQLSTADRRSVACLMRVNHAGEISAQGLYQGQALVARNAKMREALQHCAQEECDHLAWCLQRLQELDDRPSHLDPLWYYGSFCIGVLAGLAGDAWSLGFIVETEQQVMAHLQRHLERIAAGDQRSRAILEQMIVEEGQHATTAQQQGAKKLPKPVRQLMRGVAKIMTSTAYYI